MFIFQINVRQDDQGISVKFSVSHITAGRLSLCFRCNVENLPKQQNRTRIHDNGRPSGYLGFLLHPIFCSFLIGWTIVLSLVRHLSGSSHLLFDWLWILSVSLPISVQPLTVVVDCWFKIEEFPNKMAISSAQNSRDKSFFLRKLTGFVPQFWIFDHTQFPCSLFPQIFISVSRTQLHGSESCAIPKFHLFHCTLWSAFGLRRISSFALSRSTRSVQDTTPEGVLSWCWCSLTLTHTLPQWVHRRVRVPRDLDSTLYHCLVFVKFLSVSDPTMILMIELLESFISAYEYSVPCSSLWSAKKPSVLQSETIHFDIQLKADSPSETHLLLSFKQSAWICCIDCIPNPLVSVIELVCSSGNIAKLSS